MAIGCGDRRSVPIDHRVRASRRGPRAAAVALAFGLGIAFAPACDQRWVETDADRAAQAARTQAAALAHQLEQLPRVHRASVVWNPAPPRVSLLVVHAGGAAELEPTVRALTRAADPRLDDADIAIRWEIEPPRDVVQA